MNLSFAPAEMSELSAIMAIEQAGFTPAEAASKSAMAERIKLISDTFIVAHDGAGQVVGYVVGPAIAKRYLTDSLFEKIHINRPDDPYIAILSLAVDSHYRRQGIGGQLLTQLDQVARQQHRSGITLTCLPRLVPFYQSHGYVNEGIADSQHAGEQWYNMVKDLKFN